MSVSEGLRLQIDALRKEKQKLEVEKAKLKKQLSLLQEAAGNDHYEMNTSLQAENKNLQEEAAHMKSYMKQHFTRLAIRGKGGGNKKGDKGVRGLTTR